MAKEKCLICGKELHHITHYEDPIFNIYRCLDCGFYILIDQLIDYMNYYSKKLNFDGLIDKIQKYKLENTQYDYNHVCFLIGTKQSLDYEQNNHALINKLLKQGFKHVVLIPHYIYGVKND